MPKKKPYNWCEFGEHIIEHDSDGNRPHRHVYPIPECKAFPDGGLSSQGATCCIEHYPKIRKLQIKQGLVIPIDKS